MAVNGMIPSLPSMGGMSDRQSIGGPGGTNMQSPWLNPSDPFYDPTKKADPSLFNPYTSGYVSGDAWHPYQSSVPDKIIPSQRTQTPGQAVGQAQFFAGGQSAIQGQPQPQRPFEASAPSVAPRESEQAPATGMMFGSRWMPGSVGTGAQGNQNQFFAQQPQQQAANPLLGTFQQWSPNLSALQQSR